MADPIFLNDTPLRLDNGIEGQPYEVNTADPGSFYELISTPSSMPNSTIWAQVFLPDTGDGRASVPLVILVPGSLGVAPAFLHKARWLTDAGLAACVIDPFGNRGVSSTVANQAQYSFAASAWDVLATIDALAGQTKLDPRRIGAQGHSRGGSAVLSAACLQRLLGRADSLAAVYAAYPWCGQQFSLPAVGATTIRSIVGDRDEWCLPQQVQGYMQAMRLTGADATWRIVDGAHHSFDRDTPVEQIADASVAPGAPTLYIDDNGAMIHPLSGVADPELGERDAMLYGIKAGYGVRGAHIGTSGNQAEIFRDDMLAFWWSTLAD